MPDLTKGQGPAIRIVINTDELRELTKWTKGALNQLADVKLDLIKAGVMLSDDPATAAPYQKLLGGLEALGASITADHDGLANEVIELEKAEGAPPATPPSPQTGTGAAKPLQLSGVKWVAFIVPTGGKTGTGTGTGSSTNPPEPWDKGWVNPDGTMPAGAPSTAAHDGFGATWSASGSGSAGGAYWSGKGSVDASGWVDGEADAHWGSSGGSASVSGDAHLGASASVSGEVGAGPVHASGEAQASVGADAHIDASGSIGPDGVAVGGHASASAGASASASGEVDAGGVAAHGQASASAGASAQAGGDAGVGPNGAQASAGAGAFAGAKAGVSGDVSAGGVSVGEGADVRTGVGVEAHASASASYDNVSADLDVGAALGIGAGVHLHFSFSPKKIVDSIGDVAKGIEHLFDSSPPPAPPAGSPPPPPVPPPPAPPPPPIPVVASVLPAAALKVPVLSVHLPVTTPIHQLHPKIDLATKDLLRPHHGGRHPGHSGRHSEPPSSTPTNRR